MVLNYPLQCLQQLLLDISVFQFIQYCPSSSPICSSGGENGFEKSPWGLDKLPPSLSLIFCARSLPLSLSLCGRWLFISQSTRSRLKQMLITIVSPLSLFLYSFPFGYEAVDSIFLEGTFFVLPMNTSMRFPGLVGGVFLLWSITSVVLIVRCADTHLCEQFKWHNANNPCHFGNRSVPGSKKTKVFSWLV